MLECSVHTFLCSCRPLLQHLYSPCVWTLRFNACLFDPSPRQAMYDTRWPAASSPPLSLPIQGLQMPAYTFKMKPSKLPAQVKGKTIWFNLNSCLLTTATINYSPLMVLKPRSAFSQCGLSVSFCYVHFMLSSLASPAGTPSNMHALFMPRRGKP